MILARPWALLLLLGAVPVVWAYLRRAPPKRVVASSLLLLRAAAAVPARRRSLDRLLSLLLVLGALLAVSLGLALEPGPATPRAVVVLDHSASMGATADGGARLDAAREALDDWLAEFPDASVALVTTPPLRTAVPETRDHAAVRAAAAAVVGGGAQVDPAPLLQAACRGAEPPVVLLLSDQLPPPEGGCAVHRPALSADENTGVTALLARPADGLGLVELQVAADGPLTVAVDDGDARPLRPVGGVAWLTAPRGGRLTVSTPADARPADDAATLDLRQGGAVRATLVTGAPDGYAAVALRAHPRVALTVRGPADPLAPTDLLVLEAEPEGPAPAARRTLRLGLDGGATVREPAVTEQADDPLLRWVDLSMLHVEEARLLSPEGAETALVSSAEGALLTREALPGGAAVLRTGFSLDQTDLGLRAAWVNLVANLVEEAGGAPEVVRGAGLLSAVESGPTVPGDGLPERPLARLFALAGLLAFALLTAEAATAAWRRRPRA